jgi:hypothetical protein
MTIDFNNVRLQACNAYDSLCRKLNSAIQDKSICPTIVIEPEMIEEEMEELRMTIGAIASSYLPGDEDVKDVYHDRESLILFNSEL